LYDKNTIGDTKDENPLKKKDNHAQPALFPSETEE